MTDAGLAPAKWWRRPAFICLVSYLLALAAAAWVLLEMPGAHPLWSAFAADIAATLAVVAAGMMVRNASLYDPYWSIAPPVIFAYWIWRGGGLDALTARELIAFLLVTVWGVRLTFNCIRRWHSLDQEDFRYVDLRKKTGIWFPLVNLMGIALFPTLIVFAGLLPLYPVAVSSAPLGWLDGFAVAITGAAILIEALADEQLAAFKRENEVSGKVCDRGLWRLSQHPNYLGEILFWWGLWIFAVTADPAWWWTIAGPIAMTALFHFISIPMMLARKRARYPGYDEQVAGVPVLIPGLWAVGKSRQLSTKPKSQE